MIILGGFFMENKFNFNTDMADERVDMYKNF